MKATRSRWTLLVAGTLALAACGSDGESATTTTLTPVTAPPSTTAPSTTTTTPPATTTSTTLPPTTTAAPTTSTTVAAESTTTAPSTTAVPTTTTTPIGAGITLLDNGLGEVAFGTSPEETIGYLTEKFGRPSTDSGWADPFSTFGVCPGTEVRGVTWGDLLVLFSDESNVDEGRRHFFAYHYGPAFDPASIRPAGMETATGISVGSSVADLRFAYPGLTINEADADIVPANFHVNESLMGFLTGTGDEDVVTSVDGGVGCGE